MANLKNATLALVFLVSSPAHAEDLDKFQQGAMTVGSIVTLQGLCKGYEIQPDMQQAITEYRAAALVNPDLNIYYERGVKMTTEASRLNSETFCQEVVAAIRTPEQKMRELAMAAGLDDAMEAFCKKPFLSSDIKQRMANHARTLPEIKQRMTSMPNELNNYPKVKAFFAAGYAEGVDASVLVILARPKTVCADIAATKLKKF